MVGIAVSGPAAGFAGTAPGMLAKTGEYWAPPCGRTAAALVAGTLYTYTVWVPRPCTLDRIGASVTVAAVGSTLTLGVYADDGDGLPGVPLLDAGTVDGNSATAQEITISLTVGGQRLIHLAALCAGGTPTVRTCSPSSPGTGFQGRSTSLANATGSNVTHGRSRPSVAGTALPNPAATNAVGNPPIVAVRFA